ncbi:hypothetical protein [Streptomyces tendae]|uniref:hypothetical protein n=1 Tax=Streptomyces tendae TaxID=1932 RepID=UPI003EBB8018
MPDLPFSNPAAELQPFDLDTANLSIGNAIVSLVKLLMRAPGTTPGPAEARAALDNVQAALTAGAGACREVTRMHTELAALRDSHRPQPHADPTQPGALCAGCSVHGSIVSWPCGTWTAAERILNHGKA